VAQWNARCKRSGQFTTLRTGKWSLFKSRAEHNLRTSYTYQWYLLAKGVHTFDDGDIYVEFNKQSKYFTC